MRPILILTCLLAFTSCENRSVEMFALQRQNEYLRQKVDSLENVQPDYKVFAITIPKEDTITLGQEYEATIFLNVVDQKSPPVTIFFNSETGEYTDTLEYEDWTTIFRAKPSEPGDYQKKGKISQTLHGETYEFPIQIDFRVDVE